MKKLLYFVTAICGLALLLLPACVFASGGGGGVDTIKVSKCYYVANNGTLLVNASSSSSSAHLSLYLPSGAYVGEVQNGGGGKYGGSVFFVGADPINVSIVSSSGGKIDVLTAPYQP